MKLSKSTVCNIIDRFKKINSVENKQRSGCPRIFNEREERWFVRQVPINPRTSAVKMTLQCKNRSGKNQYILKLLEMFKESISIVAEYLKESPTSAKQTDKLGWHLLKCM
ncbi:HTH_Tnp_Tc3_2 domain-containing protein [Trichonephila clavipes]|nr:HTH_Tnp_Tc3_2 domain-containing protein [Trichonephila clavipes]